MEQNKFKTLTEENCDSIRNSDCKCGFIKLFQDSWESWHWLSLFSEPESFFHLVHLSSQVEIFSFPPIKTKSQLSSRFQSSISFETFDSKSEFPALFAVPKCKLKILTHLDTKWGENFRGSNFKNCFKPRLRQFFGETLKFVEENTCNLKYGG